MIAAATAAVQRPAEARLLVVDAQGSLRHTPRAAIAEQLYPGDLLVANDAATLPASLHGTHEASQQTIEVRLAGRRSLAAEDIRQATVVAFGSGDFHTPTEHRPLPPKIHPGDRLRLGPLRATVEQVLGHPRLLSIVFDGELAEIWAGIARHGRPIQYAHLDQRLALWDVWTQVATLPVSFEPPSAGFLLDWQLLSSLKQRGIGFATLTHAAGLSSTGDEALDRRLPLDEPYRIPAATVQAIEQTRLAGRRVIALGTTVTRALEHAAAQGSLQSGHDVADQRIGPETKLHVIDAIVSGVHEPGESHYELLRAFTDEAVLQRMVDALEQHEYRNHEFGDSVLVERRTWHSRTWH